MSIRDLPFRRQVRHIDVTVRDARTSAVRQQIARDFGMLVPPFALHLPVPSLLSAYWSIFREPTYAPRVDRATKEAVAAAVSASNTCPYCVDVHTAMLHALGGRTPAATLASGQVGDIAEPGLRGVVAWARTHRQPDTLIVRQRPFPDAHAPELIGVALAYHYINRMINIFGVESPFPLTPPALKPIARQVAAPVFRRLLARPGHPGASLDLLAAAPLPDDLAWAQGDPVIAEAYARAAATFDTTGEQAVPEPVRQLVTTRLSTWHGEDPGLSRSWVETAVESLPEAQRPLGRLALLAAFASHQADAQTIQDARPRPGPDGDATLIATAGWASFAAARRIGSWLHSSPAPQTHTRRSDGP